MPDRMDSLESRLERLTPGQRREVEDFVEFLFRQADAYPVATNPVSQPLPALIGVAPPPLTPDDPPANPQVPEVSIHDHVHAQGSPTPVSEEPLPLATEIDPNDDFLTHDYIDYGQFDQSPREPSPAMEAVRNVKVKMGRKEKEDKTHQLLDWID